MMRDWTLNFPERMLCRMGSGHGCEGLPSSTQIAWLMTADDCSCALSALWASCRRSYTQGEAAPLTRKSLTVSLAVRTVSCRRAGDKFGRKLIVLAGSLGESTRGWLLKSLLVHTCKAGCRRNGCRYSWPTNALLTPLG